MSFFKIENKELLKLQKEYRTGKIKENDIPKNKLEELKKLYIKEINFLEESIEDDKKKIIEIRSKISKNTLK